MSEEHIQESTVPETSDMLQSRPQRRQRRGPVLLLSLLGAVVIATVVVLVAWQAISSHSSTTGTGAASSRTGPVFRAGLRALEEALQRHILGNVPEYLPSHPFP